MLKNFEIAYLHYYELLVHSKYTEDVITDHQLKNS